MDLKFMFLLVVTFLSALYLIVLTIGDILEKKDRKKRDAEFLEKNKGKYIIKHKSENFYIESIEEGKRISSAGVSDAMVFDSYFFAEKLISNYLYSSKYENYKIVKL